MHTHFIQAKAKEEGRVKLTESVSAVDALVTLEQIAEPRLTCSKGRVLEIARIKKQRPHKMCHWRPLIWCHLRFCQTTDHRNDAIEDRNVLREVSETLQ